MHDKNQDTSEKNSPLFGGLGAVHKDLRIVQRAIKNEWQIPEAVLNALPSQIAKIFIEDRSTRNRLAAARVLVSMQSENRATAHLALQATHGHSPLITVNNLSVSELNQNADKTGQVNEIVAELQKLGIGIGEPEHSLQPAPTNSQTSDIFTFKSNGTVS